MNTCSRCRFWQSNSEYGDIGYCNIPKVMAKAWDFDGTDRPLETAHDYGCVQWEERKVPADGC